MKNINLQRAPFSVTEKVVCLTHSLTSYTHRVEAVEKNFCNGFAYLTTTIFIDGLPISLLVRVELALVCAFGNTYPEAFAMHLGDGKWLPFTVENLVAYIEYSIRPKPACSPATGKAKPQYCI